LFGVHTLLCAAFYGLKCTAVKYGICSCYLPLLETQYAQ
jgi:hypothetical protein